MKNIHFIFLFVFLTATPSLAEDPAPQTPEPTRLSADWWSYFQPATVIDKETLIKRRNEMSEKMIALQGKLGPEEKPLYAESISILLKELQRYVQLKSKPQDAELPATAPADTYTLEQAIQRHAQWKQQKYSLELVNDDIAWQSDYLNGQRKRQSRQRSEYLEMGDDNPQRLQSGLNLMISRIRLESEALELERRMDSQRGTRTRVSQLEEELEQIAVKLVGTEEDLKQWETQKATLKSQLGQLGKSLSDQKRLADNVSEADVAQHADEFVLQRLLEETQRSLLEHRTQQAELAITILKLILPSYGIANNELKQTVQTSEERGLQTRQQLNYWKRVISRVRAQSTESLVSVDPGSKLQKQQRALLKTADQAQQQLQELQNVIEVNHFLGDMINQRILASESAWMRSLRTITDSLANVWTGGVNLLGATLFELNETPVTTMGLLRVVFILTIAWWVSRIIRRTIQHVGARRKAFSDSALYTLGRVVHYVVITIGIIIGLSSIGIDLTKFALFASALGVGVGFGLQTLVSNFVAGLIILFEKTLKVGDFVELQSGIVGEVREINMRSTLVTTNDNIDILVPNSEFVNGQVTNWTHREAFRRVHVPFGVAYGTDKDTVKQAALEAAEQVPWTLKNVKAREPQVWFVEFGDSSLNFELIVWLTKDAVKRPAAVQAAYLWEIDTKLREYHIEVPFPQRDLHLRSVFGQKDEQGLAVFRPSGIPSND